MRCSKRQHNYTDALKRTPPLPQTVIFGEVNKILSESNVLGGMDVEVMREPSCGHGLSPFINMESEN